MYVAGSEERSRTLTYEEGEFAIEKDKEIYLNWEEGASGFLVSSGDTLGTFQVSLRKTEEDPEGIWVEVERNTGTIKKKLAKYGGYSHSNDFVVVGTFQGNAFKLIGSGRYIRYRVEIEKDIGLWQDKPHYVNLITGKKHRLYPYVLISGATDEDKYRTLLLSALGRMVSRTLINGGY